MCSVFVGRNFDVGYFRVNLSLLNHYAISDARTIASV